MNQATRRPSRPARRPRLTKQQRQAAKAKRDALTSTYYLRNVEGCTYKPLKVATNAAANVNRTSTTLTWRDQYNTSK